MKRKIKKTKRQSSKRTFKDSLFREIYGGKDERSKRWLLSLYNALSGKNHTNIEDLKITTIENVLYVKMKNDLSFLLDSQMNLFEHQSTINPNMPLRGLIYFVQIYQNEISKNKKDIYRSTLIKIPSPRFVVFYNGSVEQPDIVKYKLSDAFEIQDDSGEFEWTATVININPGHNETLSKNCKSLYHYCSFVNRVKASIKSGMTHQDAINEAVKYAIKENFLEGFFKEHRMNIDLLTEFDQEDYDRNRREEGYEMGVHDTSLATTKNLLALNKLSDEEIAQCCSLSLEDVLALKSELVSEK